MGVTTWNLPNTPGALEREVTDLVNQAGQRGLAPEALVTTAARVLCLLALATRPAEVSVDSLRNVVMQVVWESLNTLNTHPFAAMDRAH